MLFLGFEPAGPQDGRCRQVHWAIAAVHFELTELTYLGSCSVSNAIDVIALLISKGHMEW